MKRNSTLGLAIAAFALVLSACSSNLTVAKRQYNKGWNISLGGGKNGQFERISNRNHATSVVQNERFTDGQTSDNQVYYSVKVVVTKECSDLPKKSNSKSTQFSSITSPRSAEKIKLSNKIESKFSPIEDHSETSSNSGHNQWVALILCAILGSLGIHRFYLGYYFLGVTMVIFAILGLTASKLFFIWWLVDLIRIVTGGLGPADGSGYAEEI